MCLRTSDKMKISDKLAIRREVGGQLPPHPTEISATDSVVMMVVIMMMMVVMMMVVKMVMVVVMMVVINGCANGGSSGTVDGGSGDGGTDDGSNEDDGNSDGTHTQIGTSIPNIAGGSMAAKNNNAKEEITSRTLYKVV